MKRITIHSASPQAERGALAHRRAGSVLVVAMVSLVLVSLVLASLLKMTSLQHRQLRAEQHQLQADWLAESALDRAAARLAGEQSYSGEVWKIPAAEIGGNSAGQVTIEISPVIDRPNDRLVSVVALYPSDTSSVAKRSKQAIVRVNAQP